MPVPYCNFFRNSNSNSKSLRALCLFHGNENIQQILAAFESTQLCFSFLLFKGDWPRIEPTVVVLCDLGRTRAGIVVVGFFRCGGIRIHHFFQTECLDSHVMLWSLLGNFLARQIGAGHFLARHTPCSRTMLQYREPLGGFNALQRTEPEKDIPFGACWLAHADSAPSFPMLARILAQGSEQTGTRDSF